MSVDLFIRNIFSKSFCKSIFGFENYYFINQIYDGISLEDEAVGWTSIIIIKIQSFIDMLLQEYVLMFQVPGLLLLDCQVLFSFPFRG